MADLHKEQLEEQLGDAALALLMDEYAGAQGKALLQQSDLEMPEALQDACRERIQTFYKKAEKSALLRRTIYRAAKIAAIFAVCLSLSANLIMSVEALRVPCLNFLIDTGKRISSISFDSAVPDATEPPDCSSPLPFFPPEGFSLTAAQNNHDTDTVLFRDSILAYLFINSDGDTLQIHSLPAAGSLTIDAQDTEYTDITLGETQAVYVKNDGMRIFWIDPELERMFDIYTNGMEEADFLTYVQRLAETVQARQFAFE